MTTERIDPTTQSLTLVVGISADTTGVTAWQRAAEIAHAAPNAEVHLCHCAGPADDRAEWRLSEGEQRLGQWAATQLIGDELILRSETHVGVGDPAEVVRQLAVDVEADLIVIGTHQKGILAQLTQGSVVHDLLADAPCSVVVALPRDHADREKSPSVESAQPTRAEDRKLGSPHRYHYRRSVKLNFPSSSFGIDRAPA